LVQAGDQRLQLGKFCLCFPEACSPARRSPRRAFSAYLLRFGQAGVGNVGHLGCDRRDLFFCRVGAPSQPRPDVVGPAAHRAGPVPQLRPRRQAEHVQRRHERAQTDDSSRQEAAVCRVTQVGGHDRRISSQAVRLQHLIVSGLFQQHPVESLDGPGPAALGYLLQRRMVGHGAAQGHPAEAAPAHRVGDLPAQPLVTEAVAVLQVHEAQEGLHRDGPPAGGRVEERPERLEEHRVVKQIVHLGQLIWHDQGLFGQDRLPQTGPGP